jgi:hypothetical protein
VILVGGFAASDWLFARVKDRLSMKGLAVTRPENHVQVLHDVRWTNFRHTYYPAGTKPFLMGRYHSISIITSALELPKLLTDRLRILFTTVLIPNTSKDRPCSPRGLMEKYTYQLDLLHCCPRFARCLGSLYAYLNLE